MSKLTSQVSMDAAPSTPTSQQIFPSMNAVPSSRPAEAQFGQSSVYMDAIAGPEDASQRTTESLVRLAEEQQAREREAVHPATREHYLHPVHVSQPENGDFSHIQTDPNRLKDLESKLNSTHISSSYDSSYGSMSSNESCSSTVSGDWKDELKQYQDDMPADIRMGYLDVLILYHEDDRDQADIFRKHLLTEIEVENGPIKAMLYDDPEMEAICGSKIGHLEQAVMRSTYVFIYMTKTFVSDKWCEFQSESCLMEAITNPMKMWCVVPVYTEKRNKTFRVPMGLNTLKGVNYYNNDKFYRKGVARLIGDKINVRIQHDKDHLQKQKIWLEKRKREKIVQNENLRRVIAYEEGKTREAEEWVKQETERLIKMGVLPSTIHHSASENDIPHEHPPLHHSQSISSLKPVRPQNPAVYNYFQEVLHQQKTQGYTFTSYTEEELLNIDRAFSRTQQIRPNQPVNSNYTKGQVVLPTVENSAGYAQNHQSVNRTLSQDMKPSSNSDLGADESDIPVETLKQIQHLSQSEQEKIKHEILKQVQERRITTMHQQQQQQQQPLQQYQQQTNQQYQQQQNQLLQQTQIPQSHQQRLQHYQHQLQQHQPQQQQFREQLPQQYQLQHQQLQQQHQQYQPLQQQPQFQQQFQQQQSQQQQNSMPTQLDQNNRGSVQQDMPNSVTSQNDTRMPAFDQLNSTSSVGSCNTAPISYNGESTYQSSYKASDRSGLSSIADSGSLSPGNLPNDSLLDVSHETDGGPSSPGVCDKSSLMSRVPGKQANIKKVSSSDSDSETDDVKRVGRKKKEKKVVKHVTINVYQAQNVQIGDHNLTNQTTIPDSSEEDSPDDVQETNLKEDSPKQRNDPRMKKVHVSSGVSSHAELEPQTVPGPCTVDAAPSTIPRNISDKPDSHPIEGNKDPDTNVKEMTLPKGQVDLTIEEAEEVLEDPSDGKETFSKSTKESKSMESSQKFEVSVNINSTENEKSTAKSLQKDFKKIFSDPTKPIARTKPQVAHVSPIVQDPPNNDNEEFTCVKTVIDSEETARKVPVVNNWMDDQSQTFVKGVRHLANSNLDSENNVPSNLHTKTTGHVADSCEGDVGHTAATAARFPTDPHHLFFGRFNPSAADSLKGEILEQRKATPDSNEAREKIDEGVEESYEIVNKDVEYQAPSPLEESGVLQGSGSLHNSGRNWRPKGATKDDKNCRVS